MSKIVKIKGIAQSLSRIRHLCGFGYNDVVKESGELNRQNPYMKLDQAALRADHSKG